MSERGHRCACLLVCTFVRDCVQVSAEPGNQCITQSVTLSSICAAAPPSTQNDKHSP